MGDKVYEQFCISRQSLRLVTFHDLRSWAIEEAQNLKLDKFIASGSWLDRFKAKHRIRQRRTARFVSCKEVATREQILNSAKIFKIQLAAVVPNFDKRFILNTDQTGCQFQIISNRTYSHRGERQTFVSTLNPYKTTHSYTGQYTVALDGTLLPKVFLCMQESGDEFGPVVRTRIEKLSNELGNVQVTCSKSGKLTTRLYQEYLEGVLKPYVNQNPFLLVIDSWTRQTNMDMCDEMFVDEDNMPTCSVKVIPGKCTSMCQPLDVYFYRQVKLLIKKMQSNVVLIKEQREINSREDCIKIHSLVHHQLGAKLFKPMIQYARYACGAVDERPYFKNVLEICFPNTVYSAKCSCMENAFIMCAVCREYKCFKCFFDIHHPKYCSGEK